MTAAFIVHLNIDSADPASLASLAGDIEDDLVRAGHDVDHVEPWARQNPLPNPVIPPGLSFTSAPPDAPTLS